MALSGLRESDLRAEVAAGVAKVNWSSESLLLRSQATREYYDTYRAELEKSHPIWKATAMDHGVQSFGSARSVPRVAERIRILGGAGKHSGDDLFSRLPQRRWVEARLRSSTFRLRS
jgi:fructose/tagatose bisphosphate aldolase